MTRSLFHRLLFAACLAAGSPALAVDGVIEINQTCADQTGCLDGDAPGFPVDLDAGSYRLTSNLRLPPGATGLYLGGGEYSIDLNGFTIEAGDRAIDVSYSNSGTRVFNGFIQSFDSSNGNRGDGIVTGFGARLVVEGVEIVSPEHGILCSHSCRIMDTRILSGRNVGVRTGDHGSVKDVTVTMYAAGSTAIEVGDGASVESSRIRHTGPGIVAGSDSVITNNTVKGSTSTTASDGISGGQGSLVRGNVVRGASGNGIRVGIESVVIGNTVSNSGLRGIQASTSALVTDNASSSNGDDGIFSGNASTIRQNTSNLNDGDGIDAGDGSNVRGNTGRSNAGFGLRAESLLVGFADNVFGNNNGGTASPQVSSGRDLGGNQCDSVAVCP